MQEEAAQLATTARRAAPLIGTAGSARKNAALTQFADNLRARRAELVAANEKDLANAGGISPALAERLVFADKQISATADSVMQVVAQEDPIGAVDDMRTMPSGIQVGKMRVPLGVLLIIYESRPNVTADAAALGLKAGNAVLLRGGSEAKYTNAAIADCLTQALGAHGLAEAAQLVTNTAHGLVDELLKCQQEIDLLLLRGGPALISNAAQKAKMPVLYHLEGNCHVYVDAAADLAMATAIVENAKTRRYGVCNAAESLLVHADVAAAALPRIAAALAPHGVELRVDAQARAHLTQSAAEYPSLSDAEEEDWAREYLAPILSVKVVESLDEAISHINRYGSAHSDAIVSNDFTACQRFIHAVDSSSVLVNASTAFADGGEYGLGAEIGISTGKLHARGPVGALGLTTQKYIVYGEGNCRP